MTRARRVGEAQELSQDMVAAIREIYPQAPIDQLNWISKKYRGKSSNETDQSRKTLKKIKKSLTELAQALDELDEESEAWVQAFQLSSFARDIDSSDVWLPDLKENICAYLRLVDATLEIGAQSGPPIKVNVERFADMVAVTVPQKVNRV